jgi:hypothetical protein
VAGQLWLTGRRRGVVGEIDVGRRVPLDHYPDTYDWLVTLRPEAAQTLCNDHHGLVLRARVDDLSRHPEEVADTGANVVLWAIPAEVFTDLAAGRRRALTLGDFLHAVGDGEEFHLASEAGRFRDGGQQRAG